MARKNSVEQGNMDFADVGNSSHCISAVKHNTFAYLDSLFEDMVVVEANQNSVDKRDALHQKRDTPKNDKQKKDKLKMYSSTTDLTHDRLQSRKNDIEVGLESLQPPIRQGNATTATTMDGTSNSTISTPEEMKPKKSKKEKKQRSSYTETTISATAESNTACEKTEKLEKKRKKKRKKQSLLLSEEEVLDRVVSRDVPPMGWRVHLFQKAFSKGRVSSSILREYTSTFEQVTMRVTMNISRQRE
jgi:hypothetical protein